MSKFFGKVAVVVGRFQVSDLHQGHMDLLRLAEKECGQLMIILGSARFMGRRKNVMNFQVRLPMLQELFPNATIVNLQDQGAKEIWSKKLDALIREYFPFEEVVLYGGRDSFINQYVGKFPCVEIKSFHEESGTEKRLQTGRVVINSSDFRSGMIYHANHLPVNPYPTVDAAICKTSGGIPVEVLLGRRGGSSTWRFCGGFVDLDDPSLEAAIYREISEELPGIIHEKPKYLGSTKILDWRCDEDESIITSFFLCEYISGETSGDDDLPEAKWFSIQSIKDGNVDITKEHQVLFDLLINES